MYLEVVSVKGGFRLHLLDSGKRQEYSVFEILVRNGSIVRYTFSNNCLTPMAFHYWCRYVSGFNLFWLKYHANKGFFIDEDFEFR